MSAVIPSTASDRHLTGTTALNTPLPEGTGNPFAPFADFPEFEETELSKTSDKPRTDFDEQFMVSKGISCLLPFAHYIWWYPAEKAVEQPLMVIAQVMNIGTPEDTTHLEKLLGKDILCSVLKNAEPGMFNARSWRYWHYRFGLAKNEPALPPMPRRKILSQKSYENFLASYKDSSRVPA